MNKKFLIAWLVIFVVYMACGFVVHGFLLADDYASDRPDAAHGAAGRILPLDDSSPTS